MVMFYKKLAKLEFVLLLLIFIGLFVYWLLNNEGSVAANRAITVKTNNDISKVIINMFNEGTRINRTNNPDLDDADTLGAAMIQTALERFSDYPEAAAGMKTSFAAYVENLSPIERYLKWDVFLEYLDQTISQSNNADSVRSLWVIRQNIIKDQKSAILEEINETIQKTNVFIADLKRKKTLEEIISVPLAEDIQASLTFLLDELGDYQEEESSEISSAVSKLRSVVSEIPEIFDKAIQHATSKLTEDFETEKKKDKSLDGAEAFIPSREENSSVWKRGNYQILLDEIVELIKSLENPSIVFGNVYRKETEIKIQNIQEQLAGLFEQTRRMQLIRYNLWVTRRLSSNATFDTLSIIDTGFLVSSVNALYSSKESELLQNDATHLRTQHIRKLLLTEKIGLNAF
jgi:hypothetical protein